MSLAARAGGVSGLTRGGGRNVTPATLLRPPQSHLEARTKERSSSGAPARAAVVIGRRTATPLNSLTVSTGVAGPLFKWNRSPFAGDSKSLAALAAEPTLPV